MEAVNSGSPIYRSPALGAASEVLSPEPLLLWRGQLGGPLPTPAAAQVPQPTHTRVARKAESYQMKTEG